MIVAEAMSRAKRLGSLLQLLELRRTLFRLPAGKVSPSSGIEWAPYRVSFPSWVFSPGRFRLRQCFSQIDMSMTTLRLVWSLPGQLSLPSSVSFERDGEPHAWRHDASACTSK